MSDFQWSSTEYDERWFHVLACLLARTQQQQNPERIIDTESSPYSKHESEDESDCDSDVEDVPITPRHLAKEKGKPGLLEKFLDRLAELLSREGIPSKKGDDVCAAVILEEDDQATIYIAKNGSLTKEDREIMKQLKIGFK